MRGEGSRSALDAARFNLLLRRCDAIQACAELFREAIVPYQFNTFACGELDLKNRERFAFYVIDWPEEWRKFYLDNDIVTRDPVLDALPLYREPFTWTDIIRDHKLSRRALEVFQLAGQHGWTEGLIIPVPRSASDRYGLVALAGHGPPLDDDARAILSLMGICFFDYVRSLVPKCGFAAPPANLTPREMDCVRLVAQGQSDRVIGKGLGISQATAHEYVESAKHKLKASTRAELVGIAASLAIVAP